MKLAFVCGAVADLKDGVNSTRAEIPSIGVDVMKAHALFVGHGRELFEFHFVCVGCFNSSGLASVFHMIRL